MCVCVCVCVPLSVYIVYTVYVYVQETSPEETTLHPLGKKEDGTVEAGALQGESDGMRKVLMVPRCHWSGFC